MSCRKMRFQDMAMFCVIANCDFAAEWHILSCYFYFPIDDDIVWGTAEGSKKTCPQGLRGIQNDKEGPRNE